MLLFRYGCLINFRTRFIEHDYTASRPHSVLFAAALKFDWVGQSNAVCNLEAILGRLADVPFRVRMLWNVGSLQ